MVVATPLLLKVTLVAPSVAPLVVRRAVPPLAAVYGLVQGVVPLAQAVTVTVEVTHARLLLGSESS